MFLELYTDLDLKFLNLADKTPDNRLVVVERTVWEVVTGGEESMVIVKDSYTNKHYRIRNKRVGTERTGYRYTINGDVVEVVKCWKEINE